MHDDTPEPERDKLKFADKSKYKVIIGTEFEIFEVSGVRRLGPYLIGLVIGAVASLILVLSINALELWEFFINLLNIDTGWMLFDFVNKAYAQEMNPKTSIQFPIKSMIMIGIFSALGIAYFLSLWSVLFSTDRDRLDAAADITKTLTGFFIGVGTGYFD